MSSLADLQSALHDLSPGEKADLLRTVTHELTDTFPGIDFDPKVCGGSARIVRTRIPVWTLVRSRELGLDEADILRAYPTLHAADLANAWSYARAHRVEIENSIRENETPA